MKTASPLCSWDNTIIWVMSLVSSLLSCAHKIPKCIQLASHGAAGPGQESEVSLGTCETAWQCMMIISSMDELSSHRHQHIGSVILQVMAGPFHEAPSTRAVM